MEKDKVKLCPYCGSELDSETDRFNVTTYYCDFCEIPLTEDDLD